MNRLIIATRKSKLAQIQTDIVIKALKEKCSIESEKMLIVTEGDKKLNMSLNKIGGKGLFVKDIENALFHNKAHGAVHSMKDVPQELPEGLVIAAVTEREDVRDTFISRENILFMELKSGARIGTSSLRRGMLLKAMRKDIEVVPIRGNVQTRLAKMKDMNLDGIVLAAAGLKRLNYENLITEYFDPEEFPPAVAQGALGIECLAKCSERQYFEKLQHTKTRMEIEAERNFMRALNGDCHSAIGVYTIIRNSDIYMKGVFEIDGKLIEKDILLNKEQYMEAGKKLAEKILNSK